MIKKFLAIALIVIIGGWMYANTLQAPFQFDDQVFIVTNESIRSLGNVKSIATYLEQPSRFVAFYSFALNYYFHGLDVFGYHMTNVVIHVINALLVWWLGGMLVGASNRKHTPGVCLRSCTVNRPPGCVYGSTVALFAALIFLCHPVQTQAVAYITQRFASLATMFYLLVVCLYMKGRVSHQLSDVSLQLSEKAKILATDDKRRMTKTWRRIPYFLGAAVAAILGMFTKEIVITLPLTIIWVELTLNEPRRFGFPNLRGSFTVCLLLFCLIIPAVFSFNISGLLFGAKMSESHVGDVITFWPYVLTQFRVLATFIRLTLFPIGQNLDYDFALSQSIFEWSVLLSIVLIFSLLVAAWKIRKRHPLVAFGLFWFLLTLTPNFIPRRNIIFEHKLYLPLVGFSIALSAGLFAVMKNIKKYVAVCCVIIAVFAYLTVQRNKIWADPVALWADVVAKSPQKARPHFNLGCAYLSRGAYAQAKHYLDQALIINPEYSEAYNNRGNVHHQLHDYDQAVTDFTKAVTINRDYYEAFNNRGFVYGLQARHNLAIADFSRAIRIKPNYAEAYYNRANTLRLKEKYDLAIKDYTQALAIKPNYLQAYNNRGATHGLSGRLDLAIEDFDKALQIDPTNQEAKDNREKAVAAQN